MTDPVTRTRWARIRIIAFWWFGALIVAGSLMPAPQVPDTGLSDKLGHLLGYGLLTVLGLYAYARGTAWVLGGVFALGVCLELAQTFTPTRTFEWLDILANGAGVLLGLALVWWLRRSRGA